jgi:hypothetical protein
MGLYDEIEFCFKHFGESFMDFLYDIGSALTEDAERPKKVHRGIAKLNSKQKKALEKIVNKHKADKAFHHYITNDKVK